MKDKKINMTRQWLKFVAVLVLFLAFLYWVKSWWGLLVVPFIYDVYITKKIRWQWWKDAEGPTRFIMSWVDALVFALVAVYFINLFFFQNYVIPSSSLEKSLLTGDYLFVSKVSYGPRIPETPLTMPLTQHTLPVVGCKSYIEWPHWDYRRVKGLGNVQLNDIVVFNYPAGDSVMADERYQAQDYYQACYQAGMQVMQTQIPDSAMTAAQQYDFYHRVLAEGASQIRQNEAEFGEIIVRPTDRKENYVKRCVGLPGQLLEIKERVVYLDGKANKEPDNVQYTYFVKLRQMLPDELMEDLGISMEDIASMNQYGFMPLTNRAYETLKKRADLMDRIEPVTDRNNADSGKIYPVTANYGWTRDNYGPVRIPKKGLTLDINLQNLPIYERCIKNYEKNDLAVRDGKIFINGKQADTYTFTMDYYWMQGDNRHNSLDSRYWGFVPEDHIVGKPIFIWWSSDPDRHGLKGIRWNRLFRWVDNIK